MFIVVFHHFIKFSGSSFLEPWKYWQLYLLLIKGGKLPFEKRRKVHISALERSRGIIVYSNSGVRSGEACEILAENGFRRGYNLHGILKA
jgi:rhodanese-related sulfurtransferase